jgi:hypothetical protein
VAAEAEAEEADIAEAAVEAGAEIVAHAAAEIAATASQSQTVKGRSRQLRPFHV